MTLRFRKRIGLFGGLAHLNLSRGGVSVSAGPNGANVNVDLSGRREHPRATLGIPGTGLSYQADLKAQQPVVSQERTGGTEYDFTSEMVKIAEQALTKTQQDPQQKQDATPARTPTSFASLVAKLLIRSTP